MAGGKTLLRSTLAGFTLFVLTLLPAGAQTTITFDDVAAGVAGEVAVPDSYQGFGWSNWHFMEGASYYGNPSGYQPAVISPQNVAINWFANPVDITALPGDGLFTFNSVYMTAAWNDDLQVTITGLQGGAPIYSQTVTLSSTVATQFVFNWSDLDALHFESFGGTPNPDYADHGSGAHFAIDDLVMTKPVSVPEPATLVLLVPCLLPLALLRRR